MNVKQAYKKCMLFLKSAGICVISIGGCWILYQLRQTAQVLRSPVPTNILNLEQTHVQYIYIDDPRFKELFTFSTHDDLHSAALKKPHTFSYTIMKWWKSLNQNLAYRFLYMAQNGDKKERFKAVYSLNSLMHLKDWHYRHIAQMLDARTAITLGRMPNVDLRFFLQPPYYNVQHKLHDVIEKVHELLTHLNSLSNSMHPCLFQFLNKSFGDISRWSRVSRVDWPDVLPALQLVSSLSESDATLIMTCPWGNLCNYTCVWRGSEWGRVGGVEVSIQRPPQGYIIIGVPSLMNLAAVLAKHQTNQLSKRGSNPEAKTDSTNDGLIFDNDLTSIGLAVPQVLTWDQQLLKSCIQTLYHHSSLEEYSKDIIKAGGLSILMMVQKIFHDNEDVSILLAKILSNISLHTEYLEDIFKSGWIGMLVRWSQSQDLQLSATAARALANLDTDENEDVKYPRRIYLLHPVHRSESPTKLDVVFLHGLLGGVFVTWRQRDSDAATYTSTDVPVITNNAGTLSVLIDDHPQEFIKDLTRDLKIREWMKLGHDFEMILDDCPENTNCRACGPYSCHGDDECVLKSEHDRIYRTQCWPKDWLPDDVPYLRVLGINYNTNLSMWTPLCPIESTKSTISERSNEYVTTLLTAGVGKRPIIWVCHSMGGLLVKKMLVEEWKNGDKHDICKNTRSIIFYSTPHRGSHVAALKQTTQMLVWPSIEVQELREESPQLLKLHEEFLAMVKEFPMEVVTFSETKSTLVTALKFPLQFVTPRSADPGIGEFFEIPQDHLLICKPANRQSFLYQKLLSVLRRHISHQETKFSSMADLFSLPSKIL